jgi:hypothetical protein
VSLSSVLLCSLQFPHKNDIWFVFATGARGTGGGGGNSVPRAPVVFASSCLWSCLIYVVCACLRVVMFDTCCVVFFFVLCARGCQFICIVHF